MPPKKKGKKKKKTDAELDLEQRYKRTLEEIDALKDHLTARREYARRSAASEREWRQRTSDLETDLEEHRQDQIAITADLTREYKTMQAALGLAVDELETENHALKTKLESTLEELHREKAERKRLVNEKDEIILSLREKIKRIEMRYESILHKALDSLVDKVIAAHETWEDISNAMQLQNKNALLEFGLNPSELEWTN